MTHSTNINTKISFTNIPRSNLKTVNEKTMDQLKKIWTHKVDLTRKICIHLIFISRNKYNLFKVKIMKTLIKIITTTELEDNNNITNDDAGHSLSTLEYDFSGGSFCKHALP